MEEYFGNWSCDANYCDCGEVEFMYHNEDRKVIYYEVPRGASTSIRRILSKHGFERTSTEEYKKLVRFSEIYDYYKFSVKRNPWDRVVSCYNLFTTKGKKERMEFCSLLGKMGMSDDVSEDELQSMLPSFSEFLDKAFEPGYRNHHWAPCSDFHPSEPEVDYYLEFSDISSEWNKMTDQLKGSIGGLPHYNKLEKDVHYSDFYKRDWMIEKVRKVFSEDIKRFNYKFERK